MVPNAGHVDELASEAGRARASEQAIAISLWHQSMRHGIYHYYHARYAYPVQDNFDHNFLSECGVISLSVDTMKIGSLFSLTSNGRIAAPDAVSKTGPRSLVLFGHKRDGIF